jgi:hypothetical protein
VEAYEVAAMAGEKETFAASATTGWDTVRIGGVTSCLEKTEGETCRDDAWGCLDCVGVGVEDSGMASLPTRYANRAAAPDPCSAAIPDPS